MIKRLKDGINELIDLPGPSLKWCIILTAIVIVSLVLTSYLIK